MIFCHNPYYNLTIQTLTKKNPIDICPKSKKLYKTYKLYSANYFIKNIEKKLETKI